MFGVWARVSGGVTGTREAWCKSNGERLEFETEAEAAAEAARLNAAMNRPATTGGPMRATFRYTARSLDF